MITDCLSAIAVTQNVRDILTDKIRLTIDHEAADRAKFRIAEYL